MADRHQKNPITFRPAQKDGPWLEQYAQLHGMSERSVLGQALAAFRMSTEQAAGWTTAQFVELLGVVLQMLDLPFAAGFDEEKKRDAIVERRLRTVLSTFDWIVKNQEGANSLRYMVEHLQSELSGYPPLDYETDYAVVVAKRDGKTVEEAREWLQQIREEREQQRAAQSATDAIRAEIEA